MDHPAREYVNDSFTHTLAEAGIDFAPCALEREPLPYRDDSFRIVVCSEVLEHIPTATTDHLFAEIARVVSPDGVALISWPNLKSAAARLRLLRGRSPFDLPIPLDRAGGNLWPHPHLHRARG